MLRSRHKSFINFLFYSIASLTLSCLKILLRIFSGKYLNSIFIGRFFMKYFVVILKINCGCIGVHACVSYHAGVEAVCLEVWSNIERHHLTGRSITMTCGVRRLLSLLFGLGIVLQSVVLREKPNNIKQTSTAAMILTWSAIHHPM